MLKEKLFGLVMVRLLSKPSMIAFGTPEEDAAKAEADKKAAEEAEKKKTYTKEEFDRHTAGQRRAHEAEMKKQAALLEKLKDDARLTQEERDNAAKRLDEVEAQYKTEKELADQRVKKVTEDTKKKIELLENENKTLKTTLNDTLIDIELTTEAAKADERVPGQLKEFVRSRTIVVDVLGDDGKPTGKKGVRIKHTEVKDGKEVELLLPVPEAFKKMKEQPETNGNLFKGTGEGGLGGGNGKGGLGSGKLPTDTEAYIKATRGK